MTKSGPADAERLDAYLDASSDIRYRVSPDWRETHELVGRHVLADAGDTTGHMLIDYIHPDDRPRVHEAIDEAIRTEGVFRHECRVRRSDSSWGWMVWCAVPIFDANGEILEWFGTARDVTLRKEAETGLREGERRFKSLVEGIPQLVWRAVDHGLWTWASPQWTELTGQAEPDSHGWGWLDMVHPDDRGAAREAWERTVTTNRFNVEYRLRMNADGSYRWFATRAMPSRNDAGEVIEWLGTSTDIHDLRQLQRHQQLLLGELQHRVRNSLAVVRSIVRRTADTSETVEQLRMNLDGRLGAFARAQAVVTRNPEGEIDLHTIASEELLVHVAREGDHTSIDGPEVKLQPKVGETLALAFHELTSNALKYGALSENHGMVRISWHVEAADDGPDQLVIVWNEDRPGKALSPPRRRGFGLELLESTLHYEMDADALLDFRPTGLHCSIIIPLTDKIGRIA